MSNKSDPVAELAIKIFDALNMPRPESSFFTPFLLADSKPFDGKGDVFIEGHYDLYEVAKALLLSPPNPQGE